jgi:hypothetical protein
MKPLKLTQESFKSSVYSQVSETFMVNTKLKLWMCVYKCMYVRL